MTQGAFRQKEREGDEEEEAVSWKTKPLHGMHHRQIEEETIPVAGKNWPEGQHKGSDHFAVCSEFIRAYLLKMVACCLK